MDENQTNSFIPMEMNTKPDSAEKEKTEPVSEGMEKEEQVLSEPEKEETASKDSEAETEAEPEAVPEKEPEAEPNDEPEKEIKEESEEEPKVESKEEVKQEPKEEPAPMDFPKERMVLSPATVSSKEEVNLPEVKVSNRPNIIKNIIVIVVAVLLVGGIAGAVGYFLGKDKDSGSTKKSKKKSETNSSVSSPWGNAFESFMNETTGSTSVRPGYNVDILGLKKLCQNHDLVVTAGNTPSGFTAISGDMKLVITLEELEMDFSELIDTMVYESAPIDKSRVTQTEDRFIYEGYLDSEHPEFGYVYIKVVKLEGYYIMIQGLGDSKTDQVVVDARNISDEILTFLGVK